MTELLNLMIETLPYNKSYENIFHAQNHNPKSTYSLWIPGLEAFSF